jgi:hypothetical protein
MKKNYKNRAMRTEANEPIRQSSPTGKPENKIRIYLGPPHRERAEQIAKRMNLSLEQLIERYICQMVADGRWPR